MKVLDFGLAKAFADDGAAAKVSQSPTLSLAATQQGVVLGTAAYMSPEQAKGLPADKRADIFALGCVLFEMLTGRMAFQGELATEILASVINQEPDHTALQANLHPRIKELLRRCFQKQPKNRWQAVGDVRYEIEEVLANPSGMLVQPVATLAQAAPQPKLPWVAAIVAVAVIASVAVWTLKPVPPLEPRPVSRSAYERPEGINFRNGGRNVLASSPDGRYFVYNGTGGLYLRSIDELDARLIPGTEGDLTNPFFSPDSQWVGFWHREGRIEKIAISGGTPILVGPAEVNPFGIAWGVDDMILFEMISIT